MPVDPELLREVVEQTQVLRPPRQALATFGTTSIDYYLVSEPVYADLVGDTRETVVRHGKVTAERPQIVTPFSNLLKLFQGFEHGEEIARYLSENYGASSPGLMQLLQERAPGARARSPTRRGRPPGRGDGGGGAEPGGGDQGGGPHVGHLPGQVHLRGHHVIPGPQRGGAGGQRPAGDGPGAAQGMPAPA